MNIHVVEIGEPPTINRVYQVQEGIENNPFATLAADGRIPTEMSHYESDNTSRPPRMIDADLDTSVLVYDPNDLAAPPTPTLNRLQPATYTATDEDAGETANLTWSLEGDDATKFVFVITNNPSTGAVTASATKRTEVSRVTLAFAKPPDFEEKLDANTDNVYEVTLVVKDGTVDKMGMPHRDALKVTVKVINSEEDNQPGKVKLSNRQPEERTAETVLTAELIDGDEPKSGTVNWQWYRTVNTTDGDLNLVNNACPAALPASDADRRGFLADTLPANGTWGAEGNNAWEVIDRNDARKASYQPITDDIGRCLRATVTYRDALEDRTNPQPNSQNDVDDTLEAAYAGAERPVKVIDARNDPPVFTADGMLGVVATP